MVCPNSYYQCKAAKLKSVFVFLKNEKAHTSTTTAFKARHGSPTEYICPYSSIFISLLCKGWGRTAAQL